MMRRQIIHSVENGIEAAAQLRKSEAIAFIEQVALLLVNTFRSGGKVLIAGNGGSLCDAMHFAEELTGFFRQKRAALPAIALADPGHMSCVANDIGFAEVFARGVEAHGQPGDVFVGLTTSGNSPNIIRAVAEAERKGLTTVAFLGKEGGKLKGAVDHELIIAGFSTSDRIQEAHMLAIHTIIEMVEYELFSDHLSQEEESGAVVALSH